MISFMNSLFFHEVENNTITIHFRLLRQIEKRKFDVQKMQIPGTKGPYSGEAKPPGILKFREYI
jgi:hypothetical protein